MNENILVKLALVRYVLIPCQFLDFDYAYTKDCYEFDKYYLSNKASSLASTSEFLRKVESGSIGSSYKEKCQNILDFVSSLPFFDSSSFTDLNNYNPFDDFGNRELDSYFLGQHFPEELDAEYDEASLFYADSPEKYYQWYSELEDKTLLGLLRLYLSLLQELS